MDGIRRLRRSAPRRSALTRLTVAACGAYQEDSIDIPEVFGTYSAEMATPWEFSRPPLTF